LVVDAKARRFSNYGSNLRKNVRFEPNPIVKVRIRVSRVKMNAKNGALDNRILTAGDPCAVFPKNGAKTVLTKPTLSYMGYCHVLPPGGWKLSSGGSGSRTA
jgi:hypothetical protein